MKVIRKVGKLLLIIGGIIAGLVLVFLAFATINHNYRLNIETRQFPPPGKLVEVNGHKLHVYGEGEGTTLVFMSGHGTSSPTIDFKPLWQELAKNYRIAVIEKAGYGWSEVSNSPRDVDTILEETREALQQAGESGPYVLLPHSLSGLEALRWAQQYPREVKAIIGLDPTVPGVVEHALKMPSRANLLFMYLISRIGLSRFMPEADAEKMFPLLKSDKLSAEDKETYMALFYRSAYTRSMLNEIDYLKENSQKVKASGIPGGTPMYFFISDGSDVDGLDWRETLSSYVLQSKEGKYKYLDCGHYLHHYKADLIAKETAAFIEEIRDN